MFFGLIKKDSGKQLKRLMLEAEINVSELASLSSKSINTVSRLCNNHVKKPQLETASAITDALSVRLGRDIEVKSIWPNVSS